MLFKSQVQFKASESFDRLGSFVPQNHIPRCVVKHVLVWKWASVCKSSSVPYSHFKHRKTAYKKQLYGKCLQKVRMMQLRQTIQCGHTKFHTNYLVWSMHLLLQGDGWREVKGEWKSDWARQGPACKAFRPRDAESSSPGQRFTLIIWANLFQTW